MLKRMPHLVLSLLLLCISSLNAHASVLQLTDATFEGTTQAATGQTTGHWLVLFACPDSISTDQYNDIKLATGQLATEAWNDRYTFRIAEVNTCQNKQLAERFSIEEAEVVLLRDRQMYVFPRASLMKQGLKSETLKEFVTVEYELVPPTIVPSPKTWLNSLLPLLFSPVMKFFSAFNHLEESGFRLLPIAIGVTMWMTPSIIGLVFLAYLAIKGNFRNPKPKQQ